MVPFFGGGRDDVFFFDLGFGLLGLGMLFGPLLVGAIDHVAAFASKDFVEVFLNTFARGEGLVGEGLIEFGEYFHGAFEEVEVFVLHFEGGAFFAEIEGTLAEFVFLLALEVASELLEGGVVEVRRGHGVEGVSFSEDFQGGLGVFGLG